jgi:hypothetical protein
MSIGGILFLWYHIENCMPLPSLSREHQPVYREVMTSAFQMAWREWKYWPLALFASFLFTSGSYDVLLRSVDGMATLSNVILNSTPAASSLFSWMTASGDTIDLLLNVQVLLAVVIVTLLILISSCVAQGAIVYAISAYRMGRKPTLAEAIRVGGSVFWPVAALNIMSLSSIWVLRMLMSFLLSMAIRTQGADMWFLYFVTFLFFAAATFAIAVVQIFTLNAVILQGASLHEAISRGWKMLCEHWIVSVEIALILLATACVAGGSFVVLCFIGSLPYFAAVAAAVATNSMALLTATRIIGGLIFFGAIMTLAAFLTQLQYTAWTLLFRRLGEGGVIPKVKRMFRDVSGINNAPRS